MDYWIIVGVVFIVFSLYYLENGFPSSKPKCPAKSGEHEFDKWKAYGYTWQRRKCKNCGYIQDREI